MRTLDHHIVPCAEKEGFIDRNQLWPFYRRRKFSDETIAQIEAT